MAATLKKNMLEGCCRCAGAASSLVDGVKHLPFAALEGGRWPAASLFMLRFVTYEPAIPQLVKQGHRLLVTLLLMNAAAMARAVPRCAASHRWGGRSSRVSRRE